MAEGLYKTLDQVPGISKKWNYKTSFLAFAARYGQLFTKIGNSERGDFGKERIHFS